MSTINFNGQEIEGIFIESFFMGKKDRRGYCNVVAFLTSGSVNFSGVVAMQQVGINWIPVDCSAEEEERLKALMTEDRLKKVVENAISLARGMA
jgi:hypothetical protein